MMLFNHFIRLYLVLMTPVLLVIGSTRLLMTPAWLHFEYGRPGFPQDPYGFTTADRQAYGVYGIAYLLNGEPIRYLADLRLPHAVCLYESDGRTCPMFMPEALRHMEDVKRVTQGAYLAAAVGGLAALAGIVALWGSGDLAGLRQVLRHGGLLTLALIMTIITLSVVAWDFFFDAFHAIFFEDGTWQFYYSDTLIRLYPEQFWFDSALLVGTLTTLGALAMLIIGMQGIGTIQPDYEADAHAPSR